MHHLLTRHRTDRPDATRRWSPLLMLGGSVGAAVLLINMGLWAMGDDATLEPPLAQSTVAGLGH